MGARDSECGVKCQLHRGYRRQRTMCLLVLAGMAISHLLEHHLNACIWLYAWLLLGPSQRHLMGYKPRALQADTTVLCGTSFKKFWNCYRTACKCSVCNNGANCSWSQLCLQIFFTLSIVTLPFSFFNVTFVASYLCPLQTYWCPLFSLVTLCLSSPVILSFAALSIVIGVYCYINSIFCYLLLIIPPIS